MARALARLRRGGVVAYPTEAVFGLGCNPLDARAVARVLDIKGRSGAKGLIVVVDRPERVRRWMQPLPPAVLARLAAVRGAAVTWVVPARAWVPGWLTGAHRTLAVRVTTHPVAAALARGLGQPLVSTSANRSGRAPARSALAVRLRLGRDLDSVVPGAVGGARAPSEIRDLLTNAVLRPGGDGVPER